MLTVKDLVIIPSYFATKPNTHRNYNHAYNLLRWSIFILSYKYEDGLNIVDFKIHSESEDNLIYYVSIGTPDVRLNYDSKVKVYCSCPDFAYTFAYVLYKHDALLYPEEFPIEFKTIPPKKRNPQQIPFVCKHIYTILKYCLENDIKFTRDTVLKYNRYDKFKRPIFEMTYRFYKMINELKSRLKPRFSKRTL